MKRAVGLGALSAGQAWKIAARWHKLVEMQEWAKSPERAGGASSPADGRERLKDYETVGRDSQRRRDGCAGKRDGIVPAAAPAG